MKEFHLRSIQTVADQLHKVRLLKAMNIILEHQEETHDGSNICQSLNQQSTEGRNHRQPSAVDQTIHRATEVGLTTRGRIPKK